MDTCSKPIRWQQDFFIIFRRLHRMCPPPPIYVRVLSSLMTRCRVNNANDANNSTVGLYISHLFVKIVGGGRDKQPHQHVYNLPNLESYLSFFISGFLARCPLPRISYIGKQRGVTKACADAVPSGVTGTMIVLITCTSLSHFYLRILESSSAQFNRFLKKEERDRREFIIFLQASFVFWRCTTVRFAADANAIRAF